MKLSNQNLPRKNKMIVWIWSKNSDAINVSPNTDVTMRLFTKEFPDGLLCDTAWTSEQEVFNHFWSSRKLNDEKIKYLKMPMKKYIFKNKKELIGMNPFWNIERLEFLEKWCQKWKLDF